MGEKLLDWSSLDCWARGWPLAKTSENQSHPEPFLWISHVTWWHKLQPRIPQHRSKIFCPNHYSFVCNAQDGRNQPQEILAMLVCTSGVLRQIRSISILQIILFGKMKETINIHKPFGPQAVLQGTIFYAAVCILFVWTTNMRLGLLLVVSRNTNISSLNHLQAWCSDNHIHLGGGHVWSGSCLALVWQKCKPHHP